MPTSEGEEFKEVGLELQWAEGRRGYKTDAPALALHFKAYLGNLE
jgi:hypothetical protein